MHGEEIGRIRKLLNKAQLMAHNIAGTRDYFRIEDANGHRFWLYRDGLYGRETLSPRWFMHGVFP